MPALTTSWASAGFWLTQSVAAMWPSRSRSTTSGWAARKVRLTMSSVVTNWPAGHRLRSSTRTLPPPSFTSRVAQGSGTQAPAIRFCWKAVSVWELSWGTIFTSPPPWVSVLRPWERNQARAATSCVLPSWGVATFWPFRSAALLMLGLTTRAAPPEVAPAMIRRASPFDFTKALIVGLGPMKVASMAPENRASVAAPPALKIEGCRVTLGPSLSA